MQNGLMTADFSNVKRHTKTGSRAEIKWHSKPFFKEIFLSIAGYVYRGLVLKENESEEENV